MYEKRYKWQYQSINARFEQMSTAGCSKQDTAPTTPAPWLTEKVAVKFVQGANKDAVISVTLQEMKEQMLQRGVKGVDECSCKEDLTALMRAEKFVFDSKLFKSVPAISDRHSDSAAPATASGSRSIVWHEVLVGWKNTHGRVVANSENWVLQRKAKEVLSLLYADLRCAMKEANVPGVDKASNKDDLIRIMCKFNCVYSSDSLPAISSGSQLAPSTTQSNQEILEHVRQMQPLREESSSSDSDAPVSKAAIRLAKEAAAKANAAPAWNKQVHERGTAAQIVVAATAAAKVATKKRTAATAQIDCTGPQKYHWLCDCDFCNAYSMTDI